MPAQFFVQGTLIIAQARKMTDSNQRS